jgi:hypothetical protein
MNSLSMNQDYSLARDPAFVVTTSFFAFLTTALPAVAGQPRFLPIVQAVALTIFLAVALRRRDLAQALWLMAIWLVIQLLTFTVLTRLLPANVERAIIDGFHVRAAQLSWLFAGTPLPGGWMAAPVSRLIETLGILAGSLATAGLVGNWFLMRAVNFTGYGIGVTLAALSLPNALFAALPLWHLLRIAGYAGFVVVLAEPLLTGNWALSYYLAHRRRVLLISSGLWLLGLVLELLLAPFWYRWFRG